MRVHLAIGLLWLLPACGDEPIEVREAPAEAAGTELEAETAAPEAATDENAAAANEVEVELLEPGRGPVAVRGSTVRLHYEAWLADALAEDGAPFDSSVSRLVPLELRLGGGGTPVIAGLQRGLLGLRAGSRARLHIPASLGWGAAGQPAAGVPADADLVYEVRLIAVRPSDPDAR